MPSRTIRRALLSVTDKRGLVELARGLAAAGVGLVSTGGTAEVLRAAGLSVERVSDLTGAPPLMGGRVKTLHPRIHGAILGRWDWPEDREDAAAHGIQPLDLVVVNLYPFAAAVAAGTPADGIIEQIDIGGPTLLRGAAKNHAHVTVVVDPADYPQVLAAVTEGASDALRRALARKAFAYTAAYDAAIAAWLSGETPGEPGGAEPGGAEPGGAEPGGVEPVELPDPLVFAAHRTLALRYGENPHQRAAFYALPTRPGQASLARATQLAGPPLSYNNLLDLDAALALCLDLRGPGAVVIKHGNPCGVAESAGLEGPLEASYRQARATDPQSAFGGVVALNRPVDPRTAEALAESFLEAVIAPEIHPAALPILTAKSRLRVLTHDPWPRHAQQIELRGVLGGVLVQARDRLQGPIDAGQVVTRRAPEPDEWRALDLAWRVVRHVKSNAIVFARAGQVLGVGAGQMSRVDASRLAAQKAADAGHALVGSAVASDAFFPFADGLEAAAAAGARAVIQPGGSRRDPEVIAAADALGLAMVFTGARHFRH